MELRRPAVASDFLIGPEVRQRFPKLSQRFPSLPQRFNGAMGQPAGGLKQINTRLSRFGDELPFLCEAAVIAKAALSF